MLSLLSQRGFRPFSAVPSVFLEQKRTFISRKKGLKKVFANPGGSFMKWRFTKKYERHSNSYYHYPVVSKVTGEKIDWLYDSPKSGYEAVDVWGPHTIELKGMPMGRTPEYLQERLRRFFSKFGPIAACRAIPHPLDPYQCQGTAYVSFKFRQSLPQAIRAPLIFPLSLHSKVVKMRDLATDKENDPAWIHKQKFWNAQCIDVARQLYSALQREGPRPLLDAWKGICERAFEAEKGVIGKKSTADRCVYERFGGWEQFLSAEPFSELFNISGDSNVHPKLRVLNAKIVSMELSNRIFIRSEGILARRLHATVSIPWREGRMELPKWTQKHVDFWQHKPALPMILQYQSRSKDIYKVYDERLILKLRKRKAFKLRRKQFKEVQKRIEDRANKNVTTHQIEGRENSKMNLSQVFSHASV